MSIPNGANNNLKMVQDPATVGLDTTEQAGNYNDQDIRMVDMLAKFFNCKLQPEAMSVLMANIKRLNGGTK